MFYVIHAKFLGAGAFGIVVNCDLHGDARIDKNLVSIFSTILL